MRERRLLLVKRKVKLETNEKDTTGINNKIKD
jgi:hypothetical protein